MNRETDNYSKRIAKLRSLFDSLKIDTFLISFQPHLRYMSGFSGSAGIGIVSRNNLWLITDGRYATQAKDEVKGWKIFITLGELTKEIKQQKIFKSGDRIGFDGNSLTFQTFQHLKELFPSVKFLPKVECIEKITVVKDKSEINKIKRAVEITDRVFTEILPLLKPGVSELDIAAEISYRHLKNGAEGDAFFPIVASGDRSALPHGKPSEKKIKNGELITIDLGCLYKGYHSDMTRTIALGKQKSEARKIYQTVLDAQLLAIDVAKSGVFAKDLDAISRNHIKVNGYEKYFRHSLGHGIGLQIHESPRLSMLSKAILETGNVVTVEPGIYIPNFGGVRIEDDIVIANGYCEILNTSPKELLIL